MARHWPPEPEAVHVDPNSPLGRVIAETVAKINGCFPEGRKFPARLKTSAKAKGTDHA